MSLSSPKRQCAVKFSAACWLRLLFALCFLAVPLASGSSAQAAQTISPQEKALALLETLTPAERVGQLFMVTFQGSDAGPESEIAQLIQNYYVGGVVLEAANNNFSLESELPKQVLDLSRQMQLNRWSAAQNPQADIITGEPFDPAFIPLFVGMAQEGDGYPYDQVLSGLTQLPSAMALGATWQPQIARDMGAILGTELSALGVNMLLGPSLDVLETPHTSGASDLGVRTFGGDPFWVGKMGQAYVAGVHEGSQGRIAVAAKHFPGHGGSDRLPEEEVATVRRSLEQLTNFELEPFFAVTGGAPSPTATVEALIVSHIRYQGFQGNIRVTTRPVSFDPQAFNLLLEQGPIKTWRENGGVMISDNLGSQAIRRFYGLTNQEFDLPRRVALTAFLAGNDLLYVDDFSSGELDSFTAAQRTLEFFTQKYREDPAFAQRVDASVLRILTLKYTLYKDFSLGIVLSPPEGISAIGQSEQAVFGAAQAAATLINPSLVELDNTAPDPPNLNDRIVFITDTRAAAQCSTCDPQPVLSRVALEEVVLRRYGPQASGQVNANNLISYSLDELEELLSGPPGITALERDLKRAQWIVFLMLNESQENPSYRTLSRFLVERPDLFQQKRTIVFALNAPYFLDATDISKLTAYYGLYSKTPEFINVAGYLLFRELRPSGALPVSVPGVNSLSTVLFPDPEQVIPLSLDLPGAPITGTATPDPSLYPEYRVGDVVPVRSGVIVDYNGNPVPDGTPVEFLFSNSGDTNGGRVTTLASETTAGVARAAHTIGFPGILEIRARSDPAQQSQVLQLDIPGEGLAAVTATVETPTVTPEPSPTPTEAPSEQAPPQTPSLGLEITDWLIALLVAFAFAWSIYRLTALMGQPRWGMRSGLLAFSGSMMGYTYLALQLPGSENLTSVSIAWGVFLATLIGAVSGMLIAWAWRGIQQV